MFTGIIETLGRVVSVEERGGDRRLLIDAGALLAQAQLGGRGDHGIPAAPRHWGVLPGDSIAVNGACLTVAEIHGPRFAADVSRETLSATTAGSWSVGQAVNLEAALTVGKPLGGHLVSGHVDGVGRLLDKHEDARSWRMRFEAPKALSRYIARKGSITVDGVSLTVNEADGGVFAVNMVPHTLQHTTLGRLQAGDAVNLEVDLIARYLEKLISERS